jgi:hypothetical protein
MAPYSAVDALNRMNAAMAMDGSVSARRSVWVMLAIAVTLAEIAALWGAAAVLT